MATPDTGWLEIDNAKQGSSQTSTPTSNASFGNSSMQSQRPLVSKAEVEETQSIGLDEINALFRKAGISRERPTPGIGGSHDDGVCHDNGSDAKEEALSITSNGECRLGQCRLPCFQPCAKIAVFTAMCCALATLNGALTAGYVNSVITTIEKRFEIGSSYSGLIAASVEIGGVMSVIVVSYFGATRHIPNWIGFGALITGVGTLIFTVPHMIAPAYTVTGGLNSTGGHISSMCSDVRSSALRSWPGVVIDGGILAKVTPVESKCLSDESGQFGYVLTLVIAQMLIGIGGSPLYTLGTTYIDNHVSKLKAPSYIAFIYAFGVFGPVLGFALGALMLQFYVDYFTFDTTSLKVSTSHPRWVGAWWGGFIFIGGLLFLFSLPFYSFPKMLLAELKTVVREEPQRLDALITAYKKKEYEGSVTGTVALGKNIRDFPKAVCSILTNPIYIVTVLGICCEVSIVSGFVVFLPKYLETQFGSTKSMANLLTGGVAIPGAVIGILFGGFCLRQFQLSQKGAIQLTLVMNVIALATFGSFFCLGCDNIKIAGVTESYDISKVSMKWTASSPVNLSSTCNVGCACDSNQMEPVCLSSTGLNYFSPCHAGCTRSNGLHASTYVQNYSGCACLASTGVVGHVVENSSTPALSTVTAGWCQMKCDMLIPYMIMCFLMTFVISGTQMPLLMITLRSVREEEKSFSLGIQFVMLRLFAYIPSPIMYGKCIDSTCLLWTEQCGTQGTCLLYDLELFRYKYIGMSFILKGFAALFYLSIWFLLRRNKDVNDSKIESPTSTANENNRASSVARERRELHDSFGESANRPTDTHQTGVVQPHKMVMLVTQCSTDNDKCREETLF